MPLTGERSTKRKAGPRLIREMRKVVELLADPYCELFRPLAIDYDLIEVNQGVCWSLKDRSFMKDAIQEDKIGNASPRVFSSFDSMQEPDPKYVHQILENSLSPGEQSNFCHCSKCHCLYRHVLTVPSLLTCGIIICMSRTSRL